MSETAIPEDIMEAARSAFRGGVGYPSDTPIADSALIIYIARAILAERERHGWQPIKTAPRDGTPIIVLRPKCDFGRYDRVVIAQWGSEQEAFIWADHFDVFEDDMDEKDEHGFFVFDPFESNEFTHWMPLPSPPKP